MGIGHAETYIHGTFEHKARWPYPTMATVARWVYGLVAMDWQPVHRLMYRQRRTFQSIFPLFSISLRLFVIPMPSQINILSNISTVVVCWCANCGRTDGPIPTVVLITFILKEKKKNTKPNWNAHWQRVLWFVNISGENIHLLLDWLGLGCRQLSLCPSIFRF